MKERPPKKSPPVIRRSAGDRKPIPKDLEAFAAGDDDALWRRPKRRRLDDPRPVVLIPGLANRDARAAYQAREAQLRALLDRDDEPALREAVTDALRLRIWRGNSLVGPEPFFENVLGMDLARVRALAGEVSPESDETVALWLRAEAGAVEAGESARVSVRHGRLILDLPLDMAAVALAGMGRRAAPLARDAQEDPGSVVDRPKGVPRLSKLIERERGESDD